MDKIYDVIIIGGGPAGLTAGIYTSRANLSTLVLASEAWGGQLMQTTLVENFPGFVEGIQGPELMANMRKQAEKFGVKVVEEKVVKVELKNRPYRITTTNGSYLGRAIIIATGAEFKWLGVPGEEKLIGRGVSACATCDAAFFRNKKVVVVGGGDAAMEEALYLTKYATEVTIVHRRGEFRASKVMQERVLTNPKIKVKFNAQVTEVLGKEKVEGVILIKTSPSDPSPNLVERGREEIFDCDGVFVAIGHNPATETFKGKVELDERGFILPESQIANRKSHIESTYKLMTSVPGVFTAGDVHDHAYKQAITAAGFGCQAALEIERWLTEMR
jgi:thioredoxin reductase (NADPH)